MKSLQFLAESDGQRTRWRDDRVASLLSHGRTSTGDAIKIAIESYGVRIGIELSHTKLLNELIHALPPAWEVADPSNEDITLQILQCAVRSGKEPEEEARFDFYRDGMLLAPALTVETIAINVESILQSAIAFYAHPWLFIHAGVVSWQGPAIVLPGTSFAGKSTLVTALVAAGAAYYSDEYAVLNEEGHVVPFGRLLTLREGPFGPAARIDLARRDHDQESALRPLPIRLVAFTRFVPGSAWTSEEISPLQGTVELCKHAVAIRRRPEDALAMIGKAISMALIIRGTRGEAHDTVARLLHLDCWKT